MARYAMHLAREDEAAQRTKPPVPPAVAREARADENVIPFPARGDIASQVAGLRHLHPEQRQAAVTSLAGAVGNRALQRLLARAPETETPARANEPARNEADPLSKILGFLDDSVAASREVDLSGSVGRGGKNRRADVSAVQSRLRWLGFLGVREPSGPVAQDAGDRIPEEALPETIAAIERYQALVLRFSRADGRVDAGGKTERALNAWKKAAEPGGGQAGGGERGETRDQETAEAPAEQAATPDVASAEPEAGKEAGEQAAPGEAATLDEVEADLDRIAASKATLKLGSRNEEKGRVQLVKEIALVRAKVSKLEAPEKTKAGFYRRIAELAPYYAQYSNIDILSHVETKDHARGRTCNVTSMSMCFEALGKTPDDFRRGGNEALLQAIAAHYRGVGGAAADPFAWRLPDFLQLVAIYINMPGDPGSLAQLAEADAPAFASVLDKAHEDAAMRTITYSNRFEEFAVLFGVKTEIKKNPHQDVLEEFGEIIRQSRRKKGDAAREKEEERLRGKEAKEHRAQIEKLTKKLESAAPKKAPEIRAKLQLEESLLAAAEATESPEKMEEALSTKVYQASVLGPVGEALDEGKQVIVSEWQHFVRLEGLDETNVKLDDPGSYEKKDQKLTWPEAREIGCFHRWVLLGD